MQYYMRFSWFIEIMYCMCIRCNMTFNIANSGFSSNNEGKLFMDEINVMKIVSDGINPHVLKMIGCVSTTLPMLLLMQFVPHGSLKSYLRAKKGVAEVRKTETSLCLIVA